MYFRSIAAIMLGWQIVLCSHSPVLAQSNWGVLGPREKRAYHACLYASFINNYCRYDAWGSSEAAFRECVFANRAGNIRAFPYWGWDVYRDCRAVVQGTRF